MRCLPVLKLLGCSLALALFFAWAGQAQASIIFAANLTNSQENPPTVPKTTLGDPRPASFGDATLVLNDAMTELIYTINVFNIDFTGSQTADVNDNLTLAHFHRAPVGSNGGVVFGFIGAPFSEGTNGGTNDVVVTPFATGVGGTVTGRWEAPEGNGANTLTNQLPFLFSAGLYANFHTTQFGGGEIRGQIVQAPEPTSLALLGLGAAGLGGYAWRRRKLAA